MSILERLNKNYFDQSVSTSTTAQEWEMPAEVTDWHISAGTTDCRIRFDKSLVISSEDASGNTTGTTLDAYFYDASGATWAALTLPWTLNSMKTTDKILMGVSGEIIQGIELTIGNANSSGSILAAKYVSAAEGGKYIADATFSTQRVASDGTANGGATFGKTGLILLGPPLKRILVPFSSTILKARYWTELTVGAILDASVTVTAYTILGEHILITQAATAITGQSRFGKVAYRLDSGGAAGTLRVVGCY